MNIFTSHFKKGKKDRGGLGGCLAPLPLRARADYATPNPTGRRGALESFWEQFELAIFCSHILFCLVPHVPRKAA